MKAICFYGRQDVRFEPEFPEPEIEHGNQVLIEVAWCGICGSDLKEINDGPIFFPENGQGHEITGKRAPMALGHEMSGTVLAIGSSVKHLVPGDRVVVEPTLSCKDRKDYTKYLGSKLMRQWCSACEEGSSNICEYLGLCGLGSENGGLAEYVVYGAEHVMKIPDDVPLDVAALIQPMAVSWHAMEVSRFQKGQSALIIGAGPVGLTIILCLQARGATKIVCSEPKAVRRAQAELFGCHVIDPTGVSPDDTPSFRKLSPDGQGFHATFDCSGFPITYKTSIDALRPRGTAVNVAVWSHKPVEHYVMDLTSQEKSATGSMCYTVSDFENVIGCFEEGSIDIRKVASMITGRVKLEKGITDGINELLHNNEKHVKILITPKKLNCK